MRVQPHTALHSLSWHDVFAFTLNLRTAAFTFLGHGRGKLWWLLEAWKSVQADMCLQPYNASLTTDFSTSFFIVVVAICFLPDMVWGPDLGIVGSPG